MMIKVLFENRKGKVFEIFEHLLYTLYDILLRLLLLFMYISFILLCLTFVICGTLKLSVFHTYILLSLFIIGKIYIVDSIIV